MESWKLPNYSNPYDASKSTIINELALNGKFFIPLAKFNISRVPHRVTIQYGKDTYEKLDDLVEEIYKSKTYQYSEDRAKKHIKNLAIKSILKQTKLYGREISYKFDFIDASSYLIEI